jgi:gas vesicle protein
VFGRLTGEKFMGRGNNYQRVQMDDDRSGSQWGSWLTGLVIGAVGGAAVALLTAPKSGSEMRETLQRSTQDVPERLSEVVDDSLDLYASFLNYAQLSLEEQTTNFKRALAAGKLAAAKKREEIELGGSAQLPFQHR